MLIDIYNVLSLYVLPIPNSAFPKISINLLHAISNETALSKVANFKTTVGRRPNFIEYLKKGDAPISLNISKILQRKVKLIHAIYR